MLNNLSTPCKLGKLLKYEFRFYLRILLPLCLAVVLMALATRFQVIFSGMDMALLYLIYSALLLAMMVINIILIIQRFIDNFLKEPGSLMFTLPVTVWSLIASKAIAAFCMIIMCFLSGFISAMISVAGSENFFVVNNFNMNDLLTNTGMNITKFVLPVCIIMLATIQLICLIYLVITISHMLPRFRFIAGFVLFCVISSFTNRVQSGFVGGFVNGYAELFSSDTHVQIPTTLITLFFAALFFGATGFLLERYFNLEN